MSSLPDTAGRTTENGQTSTSLESESVLISAPLPPSKIVRTRAVWPKLLHAAALPLLVGLSIILLEGEFSVALFRRAWPVMALLALAYVGAWMLSSEFEGYPFLNQFEGALVSVAVTLLPAGVFFAVMPGSALNRLALLATGGSIAWYLIEKVLHRYRNSRLLVLPNGATSRLLSISGLPVEKEPNRPGGLDGLVVDFHARVPEFTKALADHSMKGLPTYHAGYIYELLTGRVLLGAACEGSVDLRVRRYYSYIKRAMNIMLVVASLPITGPLMALTALAIRLESSGPALFWQERIGRGGESFQLVKFRSMYDGNVGEEEDVFAGKADDRITTVGRFIRKTRIDELPQFWNVLKGEMSLIGPRPEQVGLAENFDDSLSLYHTRHLIRPGITGWAQVLSGYVADKEGTRRKLEHDLYYVKHRSLTLDLLITYLTLKTILTGFGAR